MVPLGEPYGPCMAVMCHSAPRASQLPAEPGGQMCRGLSWESKVQGQSTDLTKFITPPSLPHFLPQESVSTVNRPGSWLVKRNGDTSHLRSIYRLVCCGFSSRAPSSSGTRRTGLCHSQATGTVAASWGRTAVNWQSPDSCFSFSATFSGLNVMCWLKPSFYLLGLTSPKPSQVTWWLFSTFLG